MRALFEVLAETVTAFFFAASIGIAAGAVAASGMQRLAPAFYVAVAAFLIAAAGFGYAIWRKHYARARRIFGPIESVAVPVQRRAAPKQRRAAPTPTHAPRRRRPPTGSPGAVLSRF